MHHEGGQAAGGKGPAAPPAKQTSSEANRAARSRPQHTTRHTLCLQAYQIIRELSIHASKEDETFYPVYA